MTNEKKTFTDREIIDVFTKTPELEDKVLFYLYEVANDSLRKFILKNNGSHEEADDIIQDAIIVCYENVKSKKFKLRTTISGYIYTVGKYIWYNKQRKENRYLTNISLNDLNNYKSIDEPFELFNVEKTKLVNELLEMLGPSCRKILKESIYMKLSMQEIAQLNGLKNGQIARNKKSKCLKSLRKLISNTAYFKSILKHIER